MHRSAVALLVAAATVVGGGCDRAAPGSASTTSLPLTPNATVVYVVDGDTVDMDIDGTRERVRLIGIDTPETKKENTPVQCFGPEATAYTRELLPVGTAVHLERDVEPRDQFGRLLAYAYRADDGLFVNLAIVAGGFAYPLTIAPNLAHADEFVEAARVAERGDVGLWGGCSG